MKYNLLAGALLAALSVTACSGGGGSTGGGVTPPGPSPTTAPTSYVSKIVYLGPLAGAQASNQIQANLRRPASAGATPTPIMVVSPMTTQGNIGYGCCASGFGGAVEAVVSPMPSSSPTVTFSTTNTNAVFQTPQAGATPQPLPSGSIAQEIIGSNPAGVNVQSAGVASASIGSPVNQTPATPVFTYRAISLECPTGSNALAPGGAPAWAWDGTTWTNPSTPTGADVWMSSPTCNIAAFQDSTENDITLHFAHGAIVFSTDTPFSSLLASQWQASIPFISMTRLMTLNTDGSFDGEILFKTASGAIVKMFPVGVSRAGNPEYSGAAEVSGASIDGF